MEKKTPGIFEVKVLNYDSKIVKDARVKISRKDYSLELIYNDQSQSYELEEFSPGRYTIEVIATDLDKDSRPVELQKVGGSETFILGKKGMPAYYRGKVRVPFEPSEEILALVVRNRKKQPMNREVDQLTEKLKLKEVALVESLEESVRTYHYPESASEKDKGNILAELNRSDVIDQAGLVVKIGEDGLSFMSDMIIAKFKGHITENEVPRVAEEFNLKVVRHIPYVGNGYQLQGLQGSKFELFETCARLVELGVVEWAEPDLVFTHVDDLVPNDFLYAQQGHHQIIGTETAWDTTLGDSSIIVAGFDRGLDLTHPDFAGNVAPGTPKIYSPYDFVNMDTNPLNTGSTHGARVCGLLAANTNNGEGVAGIAPGCQLMPINRPSSAPDSTFADAYVWMAGFNPNSALAGFPNTTAPSPGADVISNSFGKSQATAETVISGIAQEAFDYITTYGRGGRGCVVVFSTGNNTADFTTYRQWAAYEKTIAVGSSAISPPDPAEIISSTSNFGSAIDLCAPGGGPLGSGEARTMSTSNVGTGTTAGSAAAATNDYQDFGQTSCACPQVAASAALMLSVAPNLNWVETRQILRDTAVIIDAGNTDPVGQWVDSDSDGTNDFSQWYGFGRLDTDAAVTTANGYTFNRDIHIRDNSVDDGTVPQGSPWWRGFDIWVRNADPATEGAAALPADYSTDATTVHQAPIAGQPNWVYARFKNIEGLDSYNFYVRIYLTHFAGAEFVYPSDFIPSNRPGDLVPSPLVPGTYLIGEAAYDSLAAGDDDFVAIEWDTDLIPPDEVDVDGTMVSWHPCILVEISPHDGPSPSGPNVWDNNNLSQKNLTIIYPESTDDDFASFGAVGVVDKRVKGLELEILRSKLATKSSTYIRFVDKHFMKEVVANLDKADQFEIGEYEGKSVIWLPESTKVRLPIPNKGLQGMIIGGTTKNLAEEEPTNIEVNQYTNEGQARGSFALSVRPKPKD